MVVKGSKSKTRPALKDYTTKGTSRFYDRSGHRVMPYSQKKQTGGFLPLLAAGLASGGISFATQKLLKILLGGKNRSKNKRKH